MKPIEKGLDRTHEEHGVSSWDLSLGRRGWAGLSWERKKRERAPYWDPGTLHLKRQGKEPVFHGSRNGPAGEGQTSHLERDSSQQGFLKQ